MEQAVFAFTTHRVQTVRSANLSSIINHGRWDTAVMQTLVRVSSMYVYVREGGKGMWGRKLRVGVVYNPYSPYPILLQQPSSN